MAPGQPLLGESIEIAWLGHLSRSWRLEGLPEQAPLQRVPGMATCAHPMTWLMQPEERAGGTVRLAGVRWAGLRLG